MINDPEFISALAALLSFIFAIYVYYQTRQILKPTDRPLVSLVDPKFQERSQNSDLAVGTVEFELKNIGKNPARNLRIRLGWGPEDRPVEFRQQEDVTMVDRLDAGAIITFPHEFQIPIKLVGKRESPEDGLTATELYIYVFITYQDQFKRKKLYGDEFWLKHMLGTPRIQHATLQDKLTLEPYVQLIYGKDREKWRLL